MPTLQEILPDPEILVQLEPEELGGILLQVIATRPHTYGHFHPGNFESELFSTGSPYIGARKDEILASVREAVAWLEGQALLVWADSMNGPHGFRILGRRGRRLSDPQNWQAYLQANLLPKQLLHPMVLEKIYSSFVRGDYETAVFQAFKLVETSVRKASRLPNSIYGVTLMREAFNPTKGPLTVPTAETSEKEALANLFCGAIGLYKNPHSHRDVQVTPEEAIEMIILANHLLKIVDQNAALDSRHGS